MMAMSQLRRCSWLVSRGLRVDGGVGSGGSLGDGGGGGGRDVSGGGDDGVRTRWWSHELNSRFCFRSFEI